MYDGHTIDCDVHYMPERPGEIEAYLEPTWREFVLPDEHMTTALPGGTVSVTEQPEGVARPDALPESGAPAGSDYNLLQTQLLDPYEIDAAVLNPAAGPKVVNNDLAAELSIARNRWLMEHWLEGKHDDRLYGALMIPSHDIVKAVEEIRRTGSDPKWCCAMFPYNSAGRHLGDATYEPIYKALAEVDLPLYIHGNTGELMATTAPYQAGGTSLHYRLEMFTMLYQAVSNHITSMIVHGVFERFPRLKVIVAEAGVSWLTWYATSLDANYELMRRESRWLRKRPSEYVHERLRVTTQPCEAVASDKHRLVKNLSVVEGIEEILCFSSDYPHWDGDAPDYIDTIFPKSWHDRLFYENAREALRLPMSIPAKPARVAAAV
jgi:uncharacterized protein